MGEGQPPQWQGEGHLVDKWLRMPKEHVLAPVAKSVVGAIMPNTLTLAALGVGLGAAYVAWHAAYGLAFGLWLINRMLDGLDGTVARLHNRQTDFGGYLDIVCDVIVYAAVPLGLVLGLGTASAYIALALLLASFYVNAASWMFLAALLEKRDQGVRQRGELTTITMPGGLIEGAETVLFFSMFLLFPGAVVPLFVSMALLVFVTVAQRMVWAARHL